MKRRFLITSAVIAGAMALTSCAGSDPLSSGSEAGSGSGSDVIIGSADFSESQLVATIYSLALQDAGIEVTEKFNIGSREVYIAAVQDGSIDLVPEYSGALLKYLDAEAKASESGEVLDALAELLPDDLTTLAPADAQNKDTLAVTEATAKQYGLTTISDLAEVAGELSLGGPPEWKTRVNGVVGLESVYGLTFKEFVSLDAGGPLTLTALVNNQVQVADVFGTDPAIESEKLVVLEDDKSLFAAENVVPVISTEKSSDEITSVLDQVSAKLTTEGLIEMNGRIAAGDSLTDIATDWLKSSDLI
ncbi:MAG TPA: ABC transporter substrate-binding protein [Glaciibacter sp.]|nr:ABC transporter substrate-binding protein [Glaciibacter sp.]